VSRRLDPVGIRISLAGRLEHRIETHGSGLPDGKGDETRREGVAGTHVAAVEVVNHERSHGQEQRGAKIAAPLVPGRPDRLGGFSAPGGGGGPPPAVPAGAPPPPPPRSPPP